jgi:hypothetical protein
VASGEVLEFNKHGGFLAHYDAGSRHDSSSSVRLYP